MPTLGLQRIECHFFLMRVGIFCTGFARAFNATLRFVCVRRPNHLQSKYAGCNQHTKEEGRFDC